MKKKNKEITMGLGSALILLAAFIIFGYWEQKEDVGLSLKEYYFEVLIVFGVFGIIFGIILIIVAIVLLIKRKGTFRLKKRHRPKVILTPEDIKIAQRKQLANSIDFREGAIKILKHPNNSETVNRVIEKLEKKIKKDKEELKKGAKIK